MKWTLERWLLILSLIGTITANGVLAGMNWQKFINQQADIELLKRQNEEMSKVYVPREVYDINQRHLSEAIGDLTETLNQLYSLERRTGEPSHIQRQFDK